ncbi:DNA (cytosine-5-)-methyltransferase [Staphylococcus epidermidis]|uniref:DNA (cytosine-5-)-methyltransferase n=1 Tax=Staphylococcus epidermidis TaxID=1282 RepID=UPI00124599C1|nr:DNA (cytosine-5-)-methyltransferase [Staphylococcus epidermidis]KAA9274407.1 DNA (cytosine-5-)-methyltransferase [Staphylococcus epidermidis]MDH8912971.1 DNA (cytosine-5-)-methyltransferase [Staphylococcus epidermidis]MDH8940806.1 DNA (cytosine-5-)-methyltransferase [Staphylococcus epidermidis]MDH9661080.1 DNA (cytosine-5-)-methyltransferase [Staphylococcus epidermidis]MDH9674159.1 DNA (cytosine-5-)-methyltransferase [Staphylococcus epidermidis]
MNLILKVIETFSGIGSQAQALRNIKANFSVEAIVEWEIGALYAYDIIHNGKQNLESLRHHTRGSIIDILSNYNLSSDGKQQMTARSLQSLNMAQLKAILAAINRTNNLVDITSIHASQLPEADLLTYSFPCQDLSKSGYWHNNQGGIDRNANNRSTLLWQIERLLKEYIEIGKSLPTFLLMENVSDILSEKHSHNFNEWKEFLNNLGYKNFIYTLNSSNFGIPQSRVRTYMISIKIKNKNESNRIEKYFYKNNLENKVTNERKSISNYLKLDYSVDKYRREAIDSTPMFTPSRKKILDLNRKLGIDSRPYNNVVARTITTKQDRHPNSGIILYNDIILTEKNRYYRNLTPRECFLLMGFDEESFEELMNNNIIFENGNKILPNSKLIRLAGNSIVVDVLEKIFEQIIEINDKIISNN